MSEGRGSAFSAMNMVTIVSLLCLLLLPEHTNAYTHRVGRPKKWTFNIQDWAQGREFKAGDVLDVAVFIYNRRKHNVVKVGKNGYNSCKIRVGSIVLTTGYNHIRLRGGMNYFICNVPGHCEDGMKLAIDAAEY